MWERNIAPSPLSPALIRDWPSHPVVCPDRESNRPPLALRDGAQHAEPHWSGLPFHFIMLSADLWRSFFICPSAVCLHLLFCLVVVFTFKRLFQKQIFSPDCCGWVLQTGRSPVGFEVRAHVGLQSGIPVGCVWEATDWFFFLTLVFLSLFLSLFPSFEKES